MAIGRTNAGNGGGGAGGTLVVTAPIGSSIQVVKGNITRTKTIGSSGTAIFNGLEGGTWAVTATLNGQTATKNVTITTSYGVTLAYFASTINVTYPAGSTCTITLGSTVYNAPNTSGSWSCVVNATGTYTVKCTNGSQTATRTATITATGQSISVALTYEYYIVNGSGNVDYTGGWKLLAYGSVCAANKNNIKMYTESGWGGVQAYSTSQVDLSKFSKLYINVSAYNSARPEAAFGVSASKPNHIMWNGKSFDDDSTDHDFTNKANCAATVAITSTGVKMIDISSLSGYFYIWTGEDGATWNDAGFTIDKVWLSN